MNPVSRLTASIVSLVPQLTKFGLVGIVGLIVDVGGFNLLRYAGGEGPLYDYPLTAKLISAGAATVVAWLGHRYWTFAEGRRERVHHEFLLFALMCTIGLGIALGCLWFSHYVLGFTSPLADNVAANVVGLGAATGFRFFTYKTIVFSGNRTAAAEPDETVSAPA